MSVSLSLCLSVSLLSSALREMLVLVRTWEPLLSDWEATYRDAGLEDESRV